MKIYKAQNNAGQIVRAIYILDTILPLLLLSGKPALLAMNGGNHKNNYNENAIGLLNSSQFLQPAEGSNPGSQSLFIRAICGFEVAFRKPAPGRDFLLDLGRRSKDT